MCDPVMLDAPTGREEAWVLGVGEFLCELAAVERAQPAPLCHRIEFPHRSLVRLHIDGRQCEVSLDADRHAITTALWAVSEVVDPSQRWVPVASEEVRHLHWAQLLHDLGWYARDMASISRSLTGDGTPLRYHRVERVGDHAVLTLTDGQQELTRVVDLDAQSLPMALPIEIAHSLRPPPSHRGWWHRLRRDR